MIQNIKFSAVSFNEKNPRCFVYSRMKNFSVQMFRSAWKKCCYIYTDALKIGRIKRMQSSRAGAEIFFAEKAVTLKTVYFFVKISLVTWDCRVLLPILLLRLLLFVINQSCMLDLGACWC